MVNLKSFTFTSTPRTIFGPGAIAELPKLAATFGQQVLLVTGKASLGHSGKKATLQEALEKQGLSVSQYQVLSEPTPNIVDEAVAKYHLAKISVVIAIGGGSVLDAGKAISAMLYLDGPVRNYLEGVGTQPHPGIKVPLIAVPTTAGTGTEATKNASLRQGGENGFKVSLRHEHLVPNIALIDPELTLSCPPEITAACGMDALAQLLESYLSPQASVLTDRLALSGLEFIRDCLLPVYATGSQSIELRSSMAYAAYLSGITLTNTGLGIVHSLASVIGGYFDIPHGMLCGTLLAPGMQVNIEKLKVKEGLDSPSLSKHARAGELLKQQKTGAVLEGCEWLVEQLEEWTQALKIPRLRDWGIKPAHLEKILDKVTLRYNPVHLDRLDIRKLLLARVD